MEKTAQNQAGAPRRRRRRRGSGASAPQAAAPQQESKTRESGKPAVSAGREKSARPAASHSGKDGKEAPATGRGRRRPQPAEAAPQPQPRRGRSGATPAPARETAHSQRQPQRPARNQRRPSEEEPGLELITRRPPKQKFSSFEEYLAAHGGMTVPLPDDAPPSAPEAEPTPQTPAGTKE